MMVNRVDFKENLQKNHKNRKDLANKSLFYKIIISAHTRIGGDKLLLKSNANQRISVIKQSCTTIETQAISLSATKLVLGIGCVNESFIVYPLYTNI